MADKELYNPTRLFIFARHAESTSNTDHVVNSDPSRPITLTARGREQARALGEQLANIDIELAVCTRFLRTRQTTKIALHGRQVRTIVEADLDEVRSGDLDGVPMETYWWWRDHHQLNAPLPKGESMEDAFRRYARAIRRLLERTERVTLVIVHGVGLWSIATGIAQTTSPSPAVPPFGNAVPYLFDEGALQRAAAGLHALAPPPGSRRQPT